MQSGWRNIEVCVHPAADVTNSGYEVRASGRRNQREHGGLFNPVGQAGQRDVVHGVPLLQVSAAVEREASAVEEVVRVVGVNLKTLDAPTDLLRVPSRTNIVSTLDGKTKDYSANVVYDWIHGATLMSHE
jgi:hypothetical protein